MTRVGNLPHGGGGDIRSTAGAQKTFDILNTGSWAHERRLRLAMIIRMDSTVIKPPVWPRYIFFK